MGMKICLVHSRVLDRSPRYIDFFFNMRSWILFGTLKITYGQSESMARGSQLGRDLEEEISPEGH